VLGNAVGGNVKLFSAASVGLRFWQALYAKKQRMRA